jgi:hypothetical protein
MIYCHQKNEFFILLQVFPMVEIAQKKKIQTEKCEQQVMV